MLPLPLPYLYHCLLTTCTAPTGAVCQLRTFCPDPPPPRTTRRTRPLPFSCWAWTSPPPCLGHAFPPCHHHHTCYAFACLPFPTSREGGRDEPQPHAWTRLPWFVVGGRRLGTTFHYTHPPAYYAPFRVIFCISRRWRTRNNDCGTFRTTLVNDPATAPLALARVSAVCRLRLFCHCHYCAAVPPQLVRRPRSRLLPRIAYGKACPLYSFCRLSYRLRSSWLALAKISKAFDHLTAPLLLRWCSRYSLPVDMDVKQC